MCTLYHRHKIKLGKKGEQKSIELHEIICASKMKHLFHVSSCQMNKHPPQNILNGTTKANKWTVFTEHHIQYSAQFSSTLYSLYLGTISERCSPLLFYCAHHNVYMWRKLFPNVNKVSTTFFYSQILMQIRGHALRFFFCDVFFIVIDDLTIYLTWIVSFILTIC